MIFDKVETLVSEMLFYRSVPNIREEMIKTIFLKSMPLVLDEKCLEAFYVSLCPNPWAWLSGIVISHHVSKHSPNKHSPKKQQRDLVLRH